MAVSSDLSAKSAMRCWHTVAATIAVTAGIRNTKTVQGQQRGGGLLSLVNLPGTSGYQWVPVGTRSTKKTKTKSAVLPTSHFLKLRQELFKQCNFFIMVNNDYVMQ